jgi:SlyX protein
MAKNAGRAEFQERDAVSESPEALAARIIELEIKLSFAEDSLESLNTTVFRQQKEISALVQDLRALRQQVQSSLPAEQRSLRDEIPPHY